MTKIRDIKLNKMSASFLVKTHPNSIQIAPRETRTKLKFAGKEAGRQLIRERIKLAIFKKN